MNCLKKSTKKLVMPLIGLLIFLMTYLMSVTYSAYMDVVREERQENLLLISRAVSRNLQNFFTEQIRKVDILTQTPGFQEGFEDFYENGDDQGMKEYIFSYMQSHQQGLASIYVLDQDGEPIFHYDQYPFVGLLDGIDLDLHQYAGGKKSGIGELVGLLDGQYGVTLVNNIYGGSGYLGTVVCVLDMEEISRQYIEILSPENGGYITVKDENGTVIIHPEERMVRFNYRRDLEGFDEYARYDSLRNMLEKQYSVEEGSSVYVEYSNNILPPTQLMASFSRMNLNGISWYVSAVMPYRAAMQTETSGMRHLGLLAVVICALILTGGAIIHHQRRERQKLKMETKYLRDMNRTLEELHRSQEQIRHYQKLTTIGMLAGGIVHEFNNLLTPVIGYAEFLMEQMGKKSEYYGDLKEIYKAGMRGKEIVEQILPFSRKEMETGLFAPVSIDAVADEALRAMELLKPSSVQIEKKLGAAGVNVYGSATQIYQVLLNLYSNGCQAMEKNGGVLTVESRRIGRDQVPEEYREVADIDYVEIVISDTGCGIEKEMLKQIFDPFFTTKRKGTGLGLSVVKNIMVNHSGFILAESEAGKGSQFHLYFPATQLPVEETEADRQTEREGKRIPVLLVDDDEQIVKYLKRRLMLKGYQTEAYTDAQRAMEVLGRGDRNWRILIVDDTMPKYRGTALARKAKQRKGLKVILLTGLVGRDAVLMKEQGIVDEILLKPVRFKALLETMERMMKNKDGGDHGREGFRKEEENAAHHGGGGPDDSISDELYSEGDGDGGRGRLS
ncbi:MAG TPA: response regulator [Candidatus Lachnoclostridium pullistercoris]|uniref:Stage 0 sporulation protein A homolog n=1 Tax=Candidatus Lachnoclostridium pullistercoris TaxID=2838632 RepID=A0A9D2PED5_9FIRM|nr:response regulator [Candidatus Lachnoclostridium pullistercoris]